MYMYTSGQEVIIDPFVKQHISYVLNIIISYSLKHQGRNYFQISSHHIHVWRYLAKILICVMICIIVSIPYFVHYL